MNTDILHYLLSFKVILCSLGHVATACMLKTRWYLDGHGDLV